MTGAGSSGAGVGTGRATAVLFARAGARVLVTDRNVQAAEETARLIRDEDGDCLVAALDVTDGSDCTRAVQLAQRTWGGLDVLYNNVGSSSIGTVVDVDEQEWDRLLRVNLTSVMLMSRPAVPVMAAGGGGSIINTSSISALRPRGLTGYSAAKGAVITLTRAMAVDHGGAGIRVNCISPGPIHTPMAVGDGMTDETRELRRAASLLGIEGTAWDVAHAALFLASDEARYVTGVLLPVDGGAPLRGPARG